MNHPAQKTQPFNPDDFNKATALDALEDALTVMNEPHGRGMATGLCGAFYMCGLLSKAEWEAFLKRIPPEPQGDFTAPVAGLSKQASNWLLRGEIGMSSRTMFAVLTRSSIAHIEDADHGDVFLPAYPYPHDPDDLRRCRLLLEQVPELAPRIGEMATVSQVWAALVARWDEICATMDSECPEWRKGSGSATMTYALMKECVIAAKAGPGFKGKASPAV